MRPCLQKGGGPATHLCVGFFRAGRQRLQSSVNFDAKQYALLGQDVNQSLPIAACLEQCLFEQYHACCQHSNGQQAIVGALQHFMWTQPGKFWISAPATVAIVIAVTSAE
jgi:hypothetical protein